MKHKTKTSSLIFLLISTLLLWPLSALPSMASDSSSTLASDTASTLASTSASTLASNSASTLASTSALTLASNSTSASPLVMQFPMSGFHRVYSEGRYYNWAGISSASQFIDEKGRFCFAEDNDSYVTVYRTEHGVLTDTMSIQNPYDSFGGAICDSSGNLYLVWGKNNETDDTSLSTVYVCKYTSDGTLVTSVSGNGSEGLPYYYNESFWTKTPFHSGNCDIAINGNLLVVNYARLMYSGHQSNTVFTVDLRTMTVAEGITSYNSHSFDQRVSPYGKNGFLLETQSDAYPRAFSASVTNESSTLNSMDTFHFWVEEGTYDRYDMYQLNSTRSRLGNILETSSGAALVAASARSLSESSRSEPYDVLVQVFDPMGSASNSADYVTSGVRSGISGINGNQKATDYGVAWLTDFAGTEKSAEVVQAVSIDPDTVVVLYEQYLDGFYDSTWYMLLNGDGSVRQEAVNIGKVRLNADEDPIYAQGAVQWVSNPSGLGVLQLNTLFTADRSEMSDSDFLRWTANGIQDISENDFYFTAVAWALQNGVTTGTGTTTFSPNENCTRAQIMTFLWRAAGCPSANGSSPFTDVQNGSYYYDAVLWAVEQGITFGTGDKTFSPNAVVTRGQTVAFLYRANGSPEVSPKVNHDVNSEFSTKVNSKVSPEAGGNSYADIFADVSADAYYANAVAWALAEGITTGTGDTAFSPDAGCTRAQIVTFLYRNAK